MLKNPKGKCCKCLKKKGEVALFSFPKNKEFAIKWTNNLAISETYIELNCVVCELHFENNSFSQSSKKRKSLVENAIPFKVCHVSEVEEQKNEDQSVNEVNQDFLNSRNYENEFKDFLNSQSLNSSQSSQQSTSTKHENDATKMKMLIMKNIQLERKLKKLKDEVEFSKKEAQNVSVLKMKYDFFIDKVKTFLNKPFGVLVNRIINNNNFEHQHEYEPEIRQFAVTLHFLSPAAYIFVREWMGNTIPSVATIRMWYGNISLSPGLIDISFQHLRAISEVKQSDSGNLKVERIRAAISFDGMHIKQNIQLVGKRMEGFVDYGFNSQINLTENPSPATEVLTFLTVPFEKLKRIPTSYFFIDKTTGEIQSQLIKESLIHHHKNNIDVYMLTGDGHKANIKTFELLGCNLDIYGSFEPFFPHPTTQSQVCCMLDASHNIKCIRNILATSKAGILSPLGKIQWKFFEHLFNVQNLLMANFGNKITKQHIKYEKCVMRVKYATELFSESTAQSMICLKAIFEENNDRCNIFDGAEATITFCTNVNSAFDLLNSRNNFATGDKRGITPQYIKEFEKRKNQIIIYFKSLTNMNGKKLMTTPAKTGFLGMCMALESTFLVANTIFKQENCPKIIFTYFFSQDLLEILHGQIRKRNGCNSNPTTIQFTAALKALISDAQIKISEGNCELLRAVPILNATQSMKTLCKDKKQVEILETTSEVFVRTETDELNLYPGLIKIVGARNANVLLENVALLNAGILIKEMPKVMKCTTCLFSCFKHGNTLPSEDVVKICIAVEREVGFYLQEKKTLLKSIDMINIKIISMVFRKLNTSLMFEDLDVHSKEESQVGEIETHQITLIKAVINLYLLKRKKEIIKKKNENARTMIRQNLGPMMNLMHQ